ncbi:MAG: Holliday junction branch migration protein RuvA [Chloroflexi bacterium]|nr:Holliday junction branch migration protein RuvA [Chloroflexota bacterium]
MIASLHGIVQWVDEGVLILDVNGVGYLVNVPATGTASQIRVGDKLLLHTHLKVSETDIALYGFLTRDELSIFRTLLGVQGVGPRTALAIVSSFTPEALRDAIAHGDVTALSRVPGIGRKTAQRLVIDLNERIQVGTAQERGWINPAEDDAVSALLSLGYTLAEAQQALSQVPPSISQLDERILTALRYLGSR